MVSKELILISDPRVIAIPIIENGDSIVDLKVEGFFVDSRKEEQKRGGDIDSYAKVRLSVAKKLLEAQGHLPNGIKILIIEGLRPLSLQKEYFDGYSKELRVLHPDWSQEKIYQEASKYVAPPEITPPHTTGGAVDLTLVGENGVELDMSTKVNSDPEESQNACYTLAENISEEAKQNRRILIDAMAESGFVNYPTEWWHWSYGDRYWAYQTKQPFAMFDSIKSD